jgi:hypothetical protein
MPDDDVNLARRERRSGAANVIDERTAVQSMQNLRQIRTHPRAQPGGQNQYIKRFLFVRKIIHKSKKF